MPQWLLTRGPRMVILCIGSSSPSNTCRPSTPSRARSISRIRAASCASQLRPGVARENRVPQKSGGRRPMVQLNGKVGSEGVGEREEFCTSRLFMLAVANSLTPALCLVPGGDSHNNQRWSCGAPREQGRLCNSSAVPVGAMLSWWRVGVHGDLGGWVSESESETRRDG